jgi:HEAT repeat protein
MELSAELKKFSTIASDMQLTPDIRNKAIEQLGNIGTREALLALLDLAANERLPFKERDTALKVARDLIKKSSR